MTRSGFRCKFRILIVHGAWNVVFVAVQGGQSSFDFYMNTFFGSNQPAQPSWLQDDEDTDKKAGQEMKAAPVCDQVQVSERQLVHGIVFFFFGWCAEPSYASVIFLPNVFGE